MGDGRKGQLLSGRVFLVLWVFYMSILGFFLGYFGCYGYFVVTGACFSAVEFPAFPLGGYSAPSLRGECTLKHLNTFASSREPVDRAAN